MTAHQNSRPMPAAPRRQKPRACLKSLRLQRIRKRKVAMEILGFDCPRVIADDARIGEDCEQQYHDTGLTNHRLRSVELGFLEQTSKSDRSLALGDLSGHRPTKPTTTDSETPVAMDAPGVMSGDVHLPTAAIVKKPVDQVSDLEELPGIGPSLIWMLAQANIDTLADLAQADVEELTQDFGVVGQILDLGVWIDFAKARHPQE